MYINNNETKLNGLYLGFDTILTITVDYLLSLWLLLFKVSHCAWDACIWHPLSQLFFIQFQMVKNNDKEEQGVKTGLGDTRRTYLPTYHVKGSERKWYQRIRRTFVVEKGKMRRWLTM